MIRKRAKKGAKSAEDASRPDPRKLGARCDLCPLNGCEGPVLGQGPKTAKVAIIGDGPSFQDVKVNLPFVGQGGELLDRVLNAVGLPRSQVYVDNATCEVPPGGNLEDFLKAKKKEWKAEGRPWHHPVDCCRPRLFAALGIPKCRLCEHWKVGPPGLVCSCPSPVWVKPIGGLVDVQVVVPAGNAALMALMGVTGIQKWRGSPVSMAEYGRRRGFFAFAGGVEGGDGEGAVDVDPEDEDLSDV